MRLAQGSRRRRQGGGEESQLTGHGLDALGNGGFVASGDGAQGFVADGDEDDGNEGEDEGSGRADVPLAEDDAQVVRVPVEEHLVEEWSAAHAASVGGLEEQKRDDVSYVHAAHVAHAAITVAAVAVIHVRMVHVRVVHLDESFCR